MITTVGSNDLLDTNFGSGWYIGLIATDPTLDEADTMASHAGWTEITDYDEAIREEWATDAAASKEVSNSVAAAFTMNANTTIAGYFITDNSTKGGSTGILFETVLFATERSVISADIEEITHTILQGQV